MAPQRTPLTPVPSTPYSRPRQFDTARLLFQRMLQEDRTPMPTAKLFAAAAAAPSKSTALHSPPHTPDEDANKDGGMLLAASSLVTMPSTPPPTLLRHSSATCPDSPRARKTVTYTLPPAPRVLSSPLSDAGDDILGSPICLATVSIPCSTVVTPRKSTSGAKVAPWAPLRPSVRPSAAYGPRVSLPQPNFHKRLRCSSPASLCSTPTKYADRRELVGRIKELEGVVRNLQRELAAQKTGVISSTPTKSPRFARRTMKTPKARSAPIRAESVFL